MCIILYKMCIILYIKYFQYILDIVLTICDTMITVRTNSKTKYIAQAIKKGLSIIQNETTNIDPVSLSQEELSEMIISDEMIEQATQEESYLTADMSPSVLGKLVVAAQRYEQPAIDRLCELFKPLIMSEAHKISVYNALGEDAENMAWVIFLETIHRYEDRNYRQLPGLLRIYLHFGLIHALHQEGCLYDCEAIDGSEDFADTVAEPRDHIDDSEVAIRFSEALSKLTEAQRNVITAVDLNNEKIKTFSKKNNCSYQNSYKTRMLGLEQLRKHFDNH